jgi:hypothetical protein
LYEVGKMGRRVMKEVGEGEVFRHLSVRCLDDIDGREIVCDRVDGGIEEDN